jgi:epoxyqueuosine reductase
MKSRGGSDVELAAELLKKLEGTGRQGRVVTIQRLHDLQEDIESQHRAGLLDEAFSQKYLPQFVYTPPESLPEATSLIVVAVPQPQVRFAFAWNGRRIALIVPPTYLHWRETDKQVEELLAQILAPGGYRVAQASLPKKLLAVRSGLAAYGRNNVTYVDGMGSFHRLVAFYSDLPCQQDVWHESRMMGTCERCSACRRSCPTGAISAGRFLLHAERCITYHNEKPSDVPFPLRFDPAWHNCLVGCLHCQRACPENRGVLGWVEEGAEFSSDETGLVLRGAPIDELPAAMVRKLETWDLIDLMDVLPRNLRAVFESTEAPPSR